MYQRVLEAFAECDYLPRELSFETPFYVARADEWKSRYRGWIRDPVMQEMYRARTLFDLRPVLGPAWLWQDARPRSPTLRIATSCTCSPTTAWRTSRL